MAEWTDYGGDDPLSDLFGTVDNDGESTSNEEEVSHHQCIGIIFTFS
jgi:hypothetical protein